MKIRAGLAETFVRLALLCAAGALLRWGTVALTEWRERFSSSFEYTWGGWVASLAFVATAGFLVGVATLSGRPRGYRPLVALVIALPPLVLLAHYVLMIESAHAGDDLPGILGHYTFYMELTSQFVLALVVGFGLAAGLQPGRRAEGPKGLAGP